MNHKNSSQELEGWACEQIDAMLSWVEKQTGSAVGERWQRDGLILDVTVNRWLFGKSKLNVIITTKKLCWNTKLLEEHCQLNEKNKDKVIAGIKKRVISAIKRYKAIRAWQCDNGTETVPLWGFTIHPAYFLMHKEWMIHPQHIKYELSPWGGNYEQREDTRLLGGSECIGERIIGWRMKRPAMFSYTDPNSQEQPGIAAIATNPAQKESVSIHIAGEFPETVARGMARKRLGEIIQCGQKPIDNLLVKKIVRLEDNYNGHVKNGLRLVLEHAQMRMGVIPEKYDTGWNTVRNSFKGWS